MHKHKATRLYQQLVAAPVGTMASKFEVRRLRAEVEAIMEQMNQLRNERDLVAGDLKTGSHELRHMEDCGKVNRRRTESLGSNRRG